MKKIDNGNDFLNLVFKDMKDMIKSKEKDSTPTEKISEYLEKLEKVHDEALADEHKMDLLKHFYYKKYIIKELPESYIKYQKGYIQDLGFTGELSSEQKQIVLSKIQENQKESLNKWIDYLCDKNLQYPTWFKYYVFRGVVKTGEFFPLLSEFSKRSKSTTADFMNINHDIISQMYNTLSKKINNVQLTDIEQETLSYGMDFKNLYVSIHLQNRKSKFPQSNVVSVQRKK